MTCCRSAFSKSGSLLLPVSKGREALAAFEMLADLYIRADNHARLWMTIDRLLSHPAARTLRARRAAWNKAAAPDGPW